MAKSSSSPVRSGYDPRKDSTGGGNWLKLEAGGKVDAVCLVSANDIISCEQCAIWLNEGEGSPVWVYTGENDPSHDLKVDKRYRAYVPFIVDGEVKIWSMGKQAHGQLLDISDASKGLKGLVLQIKRTGSGLSTKYSIVPTGERKKVDSVEEVDIISLLGPLTSSGVKDMLVEKFKKEDYDELVESFAGKRKTGTKAKKFVAPADDEDEDDDDIEDLDDIVLK